MAITACNLPHATARADVVDMLQRYQDLEDTIANISALTVTDFLTVTATVERNNEDDAKFFMTVIELAEVYERRKQRIEESLSKIGISLRNIDETPSASPKLDAAIRDLHTDTNA